MRLPLALVLLSCALVASAGADEPPPEPPPQPAITAPELVEFVEAEYPAEAKAAGLEGVVVLEILVDKTGATADVKVVTPGGNGFDDAALAAARRFVWRPGTKNGKPIGMRVTYEYKFTLAEAEPLGDEPPTIDTIPAGAGVISGVVKERGTRVPLGGVGVAAVAVPQEAGAAAESPAAESTTDADGKFELTGLPPGRYKVIVLGTDHKRGEFTETLGEQESIAVRYYLERSVYDPYQSTVEVEELREEVERRVISVEEATRIPGTRGDALRAVENMPGVARPPFGSGFLVVRGSNPEDTTPYIAGHWIPILYHFGGITSVVNSDLLSRIDYLPGNFSARYGRAIGGVVDVDLRAPRRDRMSGYLDVNVIDGGFLLEGPVGKGSWALAGRRSWIDAVFAAVIPEDAGLNFTTAPRYYDYQALLDYPVGGGRLQLLLFGVDDKLRFVFGDPAELDPTLRGAVSQHTGVNRFHATYRKALSPRTDLYLTGAAGLGGLALNLGPDLFFEFDLFFTSWRAEIRHRPWQRVRLTAGVDTIYYPFTMHVQGPRPPQEGSVPAPPSAMDQLESQRTDYELQPGAYMEADFDLGHGLTVTPGARFDWYRLAGAATADPRLSARWTDGPNTVRGGLGRYSEQPQGWESDPNFGNPAVNPEKAIHASLGYDRQVTRALRFETTFYYKWLQDVIVRDDTLVERDDGTVGVLAYSNNGSGRVYGGEVLVRHDMTRSFFGWVSYSLSRAERQDQVGEPYRPFTFDQTHILSLVASWKLPWRVEAGVRFRYVTGNPNTPIVGSIYDADADVYYPIPGAINSERIGAYHQLDVRIDKRFVFDTFMMTAYLDVQNAYNRLNPESYFYDFDFRERTTVTGLPIIPSIGIKGEF